MKYVYKIIAALGSLAVIPALIFTPMFYYKISSVALQALLTLLNSLSGDSSDVLSKYDKIPDAMADSSSLYDLSNLIKSTSGFAQSSTSDFSDLIDIIRAPLITLAVVFVLIAVAGIVTAAFAIFSKNNRKVIYSSIAGIGLSVVFKFAFESLAAPFLNGTITASSFIDKWWASFVANVENLELSNYFYVIPIIFLAVIVWTVLYNYTLPNEAKAERKRMLGEADE